jgi:hypothetical protein
MRYQWIKRVVLIFVGVGLLGIGGASFLASGLVWIRQTSYERVATMLLAIVPLLIGTYVFIYMLEDEFPKESDQRASAKNLTEERLKETLAFLNGLNETGAKVLSQGAAAQTLLEQHKRTLEIINRIGENAAVLTGIAVARAQERERNL